MFTNQIREWEGIGSQYLTIIRCIIYCEYTNKKFMLTKPTWEKVYSKTEADKINKMMNIDSHL